MEHPLKEVYFDVFCPKCIFKDNNEDDSPCDKCLEEPVNDHSHKPVNFEEKVTGKRNAGI